MSDRVPYYKYEPRRTIETSFITCPICKAKPDEPCRKSQYLTDAEKRNPPLVPTIHMARRRAAEDFELMEKMKRL